MAKRKQPCAHGVSVGPCRDCKLAGQRAWREANSEKSGKTKRAWSVANPEKKRASTRAWRAANPEKVRANHLRRNYGLSLTAAQALREAQGNLCLGCRVTMSDGKVSPTRWCVDHYIAVDGTKVVRGILCHSCNKSIGGLNHDPDVLERLAAYLRERGYIKRVDVPGTDPVAAPTLPTQLKLIPWPETR